MTALLIGLKKRTILLHFFLILLFGILSLGFYDQTFNEETSLESRYVCQDDKFEPQKHPADKIKDLSIFTNHYYAFTLAFNFYAQHHLDIRLFTLISFSTTGIYRAPPATA